MGAPPVERVRIRFNFRRFLPISGWALLPVLLALSFSCTSKLKKYENDEKLKKIDEFESTVKISEAVTVTPTPIPVTSPPEPVKKQKPAKSKGRLKSKTKIEAPVVKTETPPRREPELEDDQGFVGRRPQVDPFRVGEKVVHSVRYFKMEAGTLTFRVDPFVQVNGRNSYSFVTEIKTGSLFSSFYSVDDKVVTLMDYDLLIPRVFTLHLKESSQLKEARSFFDFEKMQATYWEKKVTERDGIEEKKQQWEILPFSQNVFSAIFYMRTFKWDLNKAYSFRVADDQENLVFSGKALRREVLETEVGQIKSIVIKPEISTKGVFKPVGDIFIWLSDDDRKLVLRIESKIKIGTLVSEVTSINP